MSDYSLPEFKIVACLYCGGSGDVYSKQNESLNKMFAIRDRYRWRKYPEEKPEESGEYIAKITGHERKIIRWLGEDFGYWGKSVREWTFIPEDNEEKG